MIRSAPLPLLYFARKRSAKICTTLCTPQATAGSQGTIYIVPACLPQAGYLVLGTLYIVLGTILNQHPRHCRGHKTGQGSGH